MSKYLLFRSILRGQNFMLNGNEYIKCSSRTARMVEYSQRVFYVGMQEVCTPIDPKTKQVK